MFSFPGVLTMHWQHVSNHHIVFYIVHVALEYTTLIDSSASRTSSSNSNSAARRLSLNSRAWRFATRSSLLSSICSRGIRTLWWSPPEQEQRFPRRLHNWTSRPHGNTLRSSSPRTLNLNDNCSMTAGAAWNHIQNWHITEVQSTFFVLRQIYNYLLICLPINQLWRGPQFHSLRVIGWPKMRLIIYSKYNENQVIVKWGEG